MRKNKNNPRVQQQHRRAAAPHKLQEPASPPVSTSDLVYSRIVSISPIHHPLAPPAIVYQSPRCQIEDEDLFPTQRSFERLRDPDQRWQYQSDVAGDHRHGPMHAFHVPARMMDNPAAVSAGMPRFRARQVTELYLAFPTSSNIQNDQNGRDDDHGPEEQAEARRGPSLSLLPEWLDVVSTTFPSVLHLFLESKASSSTPSSTAPASSAGDTTRSSRGASCSESVDVSVRDSRSPPELSSPTRVRRLYVLYRLPHLISIDGIPVTPLERRLAKPDSPQGHKVPRDDWIGPEVPLPLPSSGKTALNLAAPGRDRATALYCINSMGDDLDESDDDDDGSRNEGCSVDPVDPAWVPAASSDSLVEVDLAGGLHLVDLDSSPPPPPAPPVQRRGIDPPAAVASTPQRKHSSTAGLNRWADRSLELPYESPESVSATAEACPWSAITCGGLPMLPLIRDRTHPRSDSRQPSASSDRGDGGDDNIVLNESVRDSLDRPQPQPSVRLSRRSVPDPGNGPVFVSVSDALSGNGLDLAPAASGSKPVGAPAATQCRRNPDPRQSLSSPFPMQFRTRANPLPCFGGGRLNSDLERAESIILLPPPPPPPLPVQPSARRRSSVPPSDRFGLEIPPPPLAPPPPPPPARRRKSAIVPAAPADVAALLPVDPGVLSVVIPLTRVQSSPPQFATRAQTSPSIVSSSARTSSSGCPPKPIARIQHKKRGEISPATPISDSADVGARKKRAAASLWADTVQRRIGSARNKSKTGQQRIDPGKGGTVHARASSASASGRKLCRDNRHLDAVACINVLDREIDGENDTHFGSSSSVAAASYGDAAGHEHDLNASDEENFLFA